MKNLKLRNRNIHSSEDRDRRDGYGLPWLYPPSSLTLSNDDVHVWLAELDPPAAPMQQMAQCLSETERIKSEKFHFKRDRMHFIVSRAVLRMILGRYLQIEPKRIQFSYGPHGKPDLAKSLGESTLRFNLAHSHDLALYAFTLDREIGVDLEYLRVISDFKQIASEYFSANEIATLHVIPASQRQKAFFNCWTRKEAYIKATGKGLAQPLDQFEVSLAPEEPARLLNVEGFPEEASRWSLKALTTATGYVAALAVEGHNWRLTFWQFSESTFNHTLQT
jgi:4'-phosphopantetheinyl transferase